MRRNVAIGNDYAFFTRQMLTQMRPESLQQTAANQHKVTIPAKRDGEAGNPFFYCVGSQCFTPRGLDVES